MRHVESDIQSACVRWFSYRFAKLKGLLFAVPNGGKRNIATAKTLKREGLVAGVADLILFVPNETHHALCIEMKAEKGRQSALQQVWMIKVREQGYRYEICHSLDEFMAIIYDYLNIKEQDRFAI